VIGKVPAAGTAETIVTSLPEAVHVGAAGADGPENAVAVTVSLAVCISGGINDKPGNGFCISKRPENDHDPTPVVALCAMFTEPLKNVTVEPRLTVRCPAVQLYVTPFKTM
jgi:hypothetical protein